MIRRATSRRARASDRAGRGDDARVADALALDADLLPETIVQHDLDHVRVISVDGVARSREARERECPNIQARSRSRFQRQLQKNKPLAPQSDARDDDATARDAPGARAARVLRHASRHRGVHAVHADERVPEQVRVASRARARPRVETEEMNEKKNSSPRVVRPSIAPRSPSRRPSVHPSLAGTRGTTARSSRPRRRTPWVPRARSTPSTAPPAASCRWRSASRRARSRSPGASRGCATRSEITRTRWRGTRCRGRRAGAA